MANTYSQIYIQIVFAVYGRENLIQAEWKEELYKYITGIVTNHGQKLIAVGGNFNVVFNGNSRWARFLTWLYPHLRSIGLVYGDSAIFARRETYEKIKGFKPFPLFEDVDLYKRLLRRGQFVHVNLPVTTSSRRFENSSFIWTFIKWSVFQGLYWIGVPPRLLSKGYKQIQ